jgi:hypothetical protein
MCSPLTISVLVTFLTLVLSVPVAADPPPKDDPMELVLIELTNATETTRAIREVVATSQQRRAAHIRTVAFLTEDIDRFTRSLYALIAVSIAFTILIGSSLVTLRKQLAEISGTLSVFFSHQALAPTKP